MSYLRVMSREELLAELSRVITEKSILTIERDRAIEQSDQTTRKLWEKIAKLQVTFDRQRQYAEELYRDGKIDEEAFLTWRRLIHDSRNVAQ